MDNGKHDDASTKRSSCSIFTKKPVSSSRKKIKIDGDALHCKLFVFRLESKCFQSAIGVEKRLLDCWEGFFVRNSSTFIEFLDDIQEEQEVVADSICKLLSAAKGSPEYKTANGILLYLLAIFFHQKTYNKNIATNCAKVLDYLGCGGCLESSQHQRSCLQFYKIVQDEWPVQAKQEMLFQRQLHLLNSSNLFIKSSNTSEDIHDSSKLESFFQEFVTYFDEDALFQTILHVAKYNISSKKDSSQEFLDSQDLNWNLFTPFIGAVTLAHHDSISKVTAVATELAYKGIDELSLTVLSRSLMIARSVQVSQGTKSTELTMYRQWFRDTFIQRSATAPAMQNDDTCFKITRQGFSFVLATLSKMVPKDPKHILLVHRKELRLLRHSGARDYLTLVQTMIEDLGAEEPSPEQGPQLTAECEAQIFLEQFRKSGGLLPGKMLEIANFKRDRWAELREVLLSPPSGLSLLSQAEARAALNVRVKMAKALKQKKLITETQYKRFKARLRPLVMEQQHPDPEQRYLEQLKEKFKKYSSIPMELEQPGMEHFRGSLQAFLAAMMLDLHALCKGKSVGRKPPGMIETKAGNQKHTTNFETPFVDQAMACLKNGARSIEKENVETVCHEVLNMFQEIVSLTFKTEGMKSSLAGIIFQMQGRFLEPFRGPTLWETLQMSTIEWWHHNVRRNDRCKIITAAALACHLCPSDAGNLFLEMGSACKSPDKMKLYLQFLSSHLSLSSFFFAKPLFQEIGTYAWWACQRLAFLDKENIQQAPQERQSFPSECSLLLQRVITDEDLDVNLDIIVSLEILVFMKYKQNQSQQCLSPSYFRSLFARLFPTAKQQSAKQQTDSGRIKNIIQDIILAICRNQHAKQHANVYFRNESEECNSEEMKNFLPDELFRYLGVELQEAITSSKEPALTLFQDIQYHLVDSLSRCKNDDYNAPLVFLLVGRQFLCAFDHLYLRDSKTGQHSSPPNLNFMATQDLVMKFYLIYEVRPPSLKFSKAKEIFWLMYYILRVSHCFGGNSADTKGDLQMIHALDSVPQFVIELVYHYSQLKNELEKKDEFKPCHKKQVNCFPAFQQQSFRFLNFLGEAHKFACLVQSSFEDFLDCSKLHFFQLSRERPQLFHNAMIPDFLIKYEGVCKSVVRELMSHPLSHLSFESLFPSKIKCLQKYIQLCKYGRWNSRSLQNLKDGVSQKNKDVSDQEFLKLENFQFDSIKNHASPPLEKYDM